MPHDLRRVRVCTLRLPLPTGSLRVRRCTQDELQDTLHEEILQGTPSRALPLALLLDELEEHGLSPRGAAIRTAVDCRPHLAQCFSSKWAQIWGSAGRQWLTAGRLCDDPPRAGVRLAHRCGDGRGDGYGQRHYEDRGPRVGAGSVNLLLVPIGVRQEDKERVQVERASLGCTRRRAGGRGHHQPEHCTLLLRSGKGGGNGDDLLRKQDAVAQVPEQKGNFGR